MKTTKLDRGQVDEALERARRQYEEYCLTQAEATCREILQSKPDNPEALHLLGKVALRLEKVDLAKALVGKAVALDPKSAPFCRTLADILVFQGRLDEAVALITRAIDADSGYAAAYRSLGVARLQQGMTDEAVRYLRRAVALDPHNLRTHATLIFALHYDPVCDRQTLFDEAKHWANRFAEKIPAGTHPPSKRPRSASSPPDWLRFS